METSDLITEILDRRTLRLWRIAKAAAAEYWTYHIEGNREKKYKSNLGCRVVIRGSQFAISWFTNSYHEYEPGKFNTYSTHLRKGRTSFSYPEAVLTSAARPWELEQVLETEKVFATVREELSVLGKIRRNLTAQKRISEFTEDFAPLIPPELLEENPFVKHPAKENKPSTTEPLREDIPA